MKMRFPKNCTIGELETRIAQLNRSIYGPPALKSDSSFNDQYFVELVLITDSQDSEQVKQSIGGNKVREFDSFFVWVEFGEYLVVWGFAGTVPANDKRLVRVK
jgi:hypothetical protein